MSSQCDPTHSFGFEILKLLDSVAKNEGLQTYDIKSTQGSMKGDGYIGQITAVVMTEISSSDKKVLNLVVKSAKHNALRNEMPIADIFQREIYMYDTIIPAFQQFLARKGLSRIDNFAKCYKATTVNKSEALILENLKIKGFKLWERRLPMNEEHVDFVMKHYGRFHALSYAVRDQDPGLLNKITRNFDDIVEKFSNSKGFQTMIVTECYKRVESLNSSEHSEAIKRFKCIIDEIPQIMGSISKLIDKYSAILHGDCWTNNMMFGYDDAQNPTTPTKMCFIDLQIARLGPPVLDLAYFFYACSSRKIIDNFQYYLDLYYNSLADYLKEMGSNPDELYPYSVFLKQWKDNARFGLIMSILVIKIMLSEQDEVADLADFAESGKTINDAFNYDIANTEEYNKRVKHIILHFVNNKFI